MNKPATNPAQVNGAIAALKSATTNGAAVLLVDGIGMTFRVHPGNVERMLALGYKRAPESR